MILYTYFRSSAAYRARMALSLKGIAYESRFVHLLRNGGEQHDPAYRRLNPLGRVPTLVDDGRVINQSVAIMEYLEETHPGPALLPSDPVERAHVRAITQVFAADTQPLQNLVVKIYLRDVLHQTNAATDEWMRHWMNNGLAAVEQMLAGNSTEGGPAYCVGSFPTMADICLVAQCFSSRRMGVSVDAYPRVARIDEHCRSLPQFAAAAPQAQPDFEP